MRASLPSSRNGATISTWFVTRMGIFATMLGMGTEAFSVALFEDRALVEEILDRYVDWACVVAEHACRMGFDAYVTTDDMAFKTGTVLLPEGLSRAGDAPLSPPARKGHAALDHPQRRQHAAVHG